MNSIAIFMEGGGSGKESRSRLRSEMDEFLSELKKSARERAWRWNVACRGGREETFDAFRTACRSGDHVIVILLVDAEGPVHRHPRLHLSENDGWNMNGVEEDRVHLMVRTMETWIIADRKALESYYGPDFVGNALPKARDLELVAKNDVADALRRETRRTRKGAYHKINHAVELLRRIDSAEVRRRCRHCERLFSVLGSAISASSNS